MCRPLFLGNIGFLKKLYNIFYNLKKGEGKAAPSVSMKGVKDEKNKPAGCAHFLGYLKTRPKGSPIPDECLLCAAIMECM